MKTALIGLGMVGGTYADALSNLAPDVTLSGIYARSSDSRDAFLREFAAKLPEGCKSYGSIDEIAEDPDLDFVILATPPNARLDIVRRLVAAGKPILMEKPVERTLPAAVEICDLCDAGGVPLGIVLQHRMRPSAQRLAALLADGSLGALAAVEARIPWWRAQSYYDEPGRGSYERDGGGVLLSQAIHPLDLMLSLTGPVDKVSALAATTALHNMESEDFVSAGVTFANGAVGSIFATTAAFPGRSDELVFYCANGTARLQSDLLELDWQDGRKDVFGQDAPSGAGADPMAYSSERHRALIEDFATSLRDQRPSVVTGRDALMVHGLIEAIEISARDGKTVAVRNMTGGQ
ncbi:Gfo/Idh/MocA family protein [Pseudoruegeria sp. SK021]|uniref:Gfo/Idh/MocA family protein n=1 Tax=Pseudoruegeria sp. SK021 TaxID=1933035 RepID=UPI000A21C2EB|nr:Gfo/Idh/MocA family oxidoreductase [Pseudoruegeria sp. SK021]OSP54704.1 oxidoreductase [Pseudoruegeria sp. SK021]